MKTLILSSTIVILLLSGCFQSKNNLTVTTPKASQTANELTISGVIIEKETQGKDGAIWQFQSLEGKSYSLVVSIPNLGLVESENIKYIKPGANVTITGESYQLGKKHNLIAKKIKPR